MNRRHRCSRPLAASSRWPSLGRRWPPLESARPRTAAGRGRAAPGVRAAGQARLRDQHREQGLRRDLGRRLRRRRTSSQTLRAKGVLLNTYYGTAHNSQPNYVAQISGQGPNPEMQARLPDLLAVRRAPGTAAPGPGRRAAAASSPRACRRLPRQLTAHGLTLEGLHGGHGHAVPAPGARTPRTPPSRRRPATSTPRGTTRSCTSARSSTAAATARSTSSTWPRCTADLAHATHHPQPRPTSPRTCATTATTRRASTAGPAAWRRSNAWMKTWVPKILASPAFRQDGVLVITADESDGPQSDATACCGEGPRPNSPAARHHRPRRRPDRRAGDLAVDAGRTPGAPRRTTTTRCWPRSRRSSGSPKLGYAAPPDSTPFGLDVYNSGWNG